MQKDVKWKRVNKKTIREWVSKKWDKGRTDVQITLDSCLFILFIYVFYFSFSLKSVIERFGLFTWRIFRYIVLTSVTYVGKVLCKRKISDDISLSLKLLEVNKQMNG